MIVMPTIPLRNKNAGMVYQHMHFRDGECDKITASAGEDAWQAGGSYGAAAGSVVPKARCGLEQKLPVDAGSGYPLSKLTCEIGGVNVEAWRFGFAGFVSDDMPRPPFASAPARHEPHRAPPSRPSSIRGCPQSRQWPSERQRLRAAASVSPGRMFARRRRSHAPRAERVSSGARPSRRIQSPSSPMATTRVISTA